MPVSSRTAGPAAHSAGTRSAVGRGGPIGNVAGSSLPLVGNLRTVHEGTVTRGPCHGPGHRLGERSTLMAPLPNDGPAPTPCLCRSDLRDVVHRLQGAGSAGCAAGGSPGNCSSSLGRSRSRIESMAGRSTARATSTTAATISGPPLTAVSHGPRSQRPRASGSPTSSGGRIRRQTRFTRSCSPTSGAGGWWSRACS